MKKILGLLAMVLIMGCDDGDMTFQTFNFGNVQANSCDDGIVYKINGNEVLVLDIDEAFFVNDTTPEGEPRVVTIGATGSNTVRYYRYANTVSGSAICNPTLAQPPVETWVANGGTITIDTNANYNDDENDDEEPILTGYTHTIKIISLSLTRNDETIIIQNNEFGDYVTDLEYVFDFDDENLQIERCETGNTDRLYITSQNEVLRMDLDPSLFVNVVTAPGEDPRVQVLDGNELRLDIYANSSYSDAHTCDPDSAVPNPERTGIWKAVSGTVQVTTTSPVAGQYDHQIKLVNVTFQNIQETAEEFTRDNYMLPPYIVNE